MNGVTLEFTVEGKPQPKQRARKTSAGHWYTPSPTRNYEKKVAMTGLLARMTLGQSWPVRRSKVKYVVEMTIWFPDNRSRDIDNVAKSILDGLNGILWWDDKQVDRLVVAKRQDKHKPRVDISVSVVQ